VIVTLIVFWPVGLILLGTRLSQDRAKQMALGGVFMVVGTLLGAFFLLVAWVCLTGSPPGESKRAREGSVGAAIACAAIAAGGFALAAKGAALRRKRHRVQHYLKLIVNQGIARVDEIAIASGRADFNKVMAEIQALIHEGFLPGYRLDTEARMVIHYGSHDHRPEEIGFACKSCGANNLILALGAYVRCEYCGTAVKV
jgi:hypothetical protein